jgi:hypothetical protein
VYGLARDHDEISDLATLSKSPIAVEAVRRIDELFEIERTINGKTPAERVAVRHERAKPLINDLEVWMRQQRDRLAPSHDSPKLSTTSSAAGSPSPASSTTAGSVYPTTPRSVQSDAWRCLSHCAKPAARNDGELLQRLTLHAGYDARNEPTRLAHFNHGDHRSVLSGSRVVRQRLRSFNFCMGAPSIQFSANGYDILAAAPIASLLAGLAPVGMAATADSDHMAA